MAVTVVSVDQMREVDRLMTEEAGVSLLQMMENAGRCLATQARAIVGGDARGRKVVVLTGRGGNGGGGLAAARRLVGWGAAVTVVAAQSRDEMPGVPAQQLSILEWIGGPARFGADGIPEPFTRPDPRIYPPSASPLHASPPGALPPR